jgi:hypothetical protein
MAGVTRAPVKELASGNITFRDAQDGVSVIATTCFRQAA